MALGIAACASGTSRTGTNPGAEPASEPATTVVVPPAPSRDWPVRTRENVDLWLHGFALLDEDSSLVPLFRRGYVQEITALKNRANVTTQLDVNRDRLRTQLAGSSLLVNAQFVPFYFSSVDEMRTVIDRFIAVTGNVQAARSREEALQFAVLASYFQTSAERAWLSLFASALWDENTRFYHSYWVAQQRERAPVMDSVQAIWQTRVRPRLQGVLNNTQQRTGEVLLSLPLDGEGRSMTGSNGASTGQQNNVITVSFPERPANAVDATFVMVHELVAALANVAIADNTTPAEKRNGVADRVASAAAVRGGLMLLERLVPDMADGYARYYVRATGRTASSDPRAQLATIFPLPQAVLVSLRRQIEQVQGGI